LAIHHLVHAHGRLEEQPQVEETRLKRQMLPGPERVIGTVADGLVAVPPQRGQRRRKLFAARPIWLGGQGAGTRQQAGFVKRLRRAKGAASAVARRCASGQTGGQGKQPGGQLLEQVATMHGSRRSQG
jgi:hypothetical protein